MTQNNFIDSLKELNINITEEQLNKLECYYNMLIEWNEKINLTAITEKEQVYLKHFYDSLTIVKAIDLNTIETLCDIGTGAGFPGLVLKIVFPHLNIVLVDSLNKRIDFLKLVINELKLTNIEAIHCRAEEYAIKNREKFDVVTARAVASLNVLLEYSIPLVKVNHYFIPLKGNVEEELKTLNNALQLMDTKIVSKEDFLLPNENSKRTIIKFQKSKVTNKKFPRKFSEIKKKPL